MNAQPVILFAQTMGMHGFSRMPYSNDWVGSRGDLSIVWIRKCITPHFPPPGLNTCQVSPGVCCCRLSLLQNHRLLKSVLHTL